MSGEHALERTDQVVSEYTGQPKESLKEGERTKWERFLAYLLPWLRRKWRQADALLEAEIIAEVAKAKREVHLTRQEKAKADIAEAKAKRIALMAEGMEREKIEAAEFEIINDGQEGGHENLYPELEALYDKIRQLELKYGARIRILGPEDELPGETEEK